jgi:hypothetical protein
MEAQSLEKDLLTARSRIAEIQVSMSACPDRPAETPNPAAFLALPERQGSRHRSAIDASVNASCAMDERICPADAIVATSAVSLPYSKRLVRLLSSTLARAGVIRPRAAARAVVCCHRSRESLIGNLVTDAMRSFLTYRYTRRGLHTCELRNAGIPLIPQRRFGYISGEYISLLNGGAIRAGTKSRLASL